MNFWLSYAFATCLLLVCISLPAESRVVEITDRNHAEIIANSDLTVITFYAPWCGYSTMFAPVFEAAANKMSEMFPDDTKIVFGRVNGDNYGSLMTYHKIMKYPSVKLVRYGYVFHNEYRGPRTVDGVLDYVRKQLNDPTHVFEDLRDITNHSEDKKLVIGYFADNSSKSYDTFARVAKSLRDDCSFHAGFGDASSIMRQDNQDLIVFRAEKTAPPILDERYHGDVENFTQLLKWVYPQCFPMVREITFENAEAITEEGHPMFILFYHPNNKEIKKTFTKMVEQMLNDTANTHLELVNFLTADGVQFSHPLKSLERSEEQLPLLALDSLVHMYLYPEDKDILDPVSISQFVNDLYSGKLHREFHYGPDPTPEAPAPSETEEDPSPEEGDTSTEDNEISSEDGSSSNEVEDTSLKVEVTSPKESVFKKLAPSDKRYTLLRDEF